MDLGFCIAVTSTNGTTIVDLVGELDQHTAPRLEHALRVVQGSLVVDCARLTFIDGSGVAVLAYVARLNDNMTLRNVQPQCRRVLEIAGMTDLVAGDDAQSRASATLTE